MADWEKRGFAARFPAFSQLNWSLPRCRLWWGKAAERIEFVPAVCYVSCFGFFSAPLFFWINVFRTWERANWEDRWSDLKQASGTSFRKGRAGGGAQQIRLRGSGTLWKKIPPRKSPRTAFKLCMSSSVHSSVNSYALNGLGWLTAASGPCCHSWRGGGFFFFFHLHVEKQSETKITKEVGLSGGCRSGGQGETTKSRP